MECASILMERGEWSCTTAASFDEEMDFMANDHSFSSSFIDPNLYSWPQGTSSYSCGSDDLAYQCHENYYLSDSDKLFAVNESSLPVEFCLNSNGVVQVYPNNPMYINDSVNNEVICENLEVSETQLIKPENSEPSTKSEMEEKSSEDSSQVGRKRSLNSEGRISNQTRICLEDSWFGLKTLHYTALRVQKAKRNTRSKRTRKLVEADDEERPNVKTRADRGSATDPQSLYARKRRQRINEKLRILQKLVPNGTKVDLSTMLEEAVSYVKFLQLQIKLMSSDELWMYAPLAYNGMDIGLDSKLNSLLSSDCV